MQKTLWIATLDIGYVDLIFPFYAADEAEAKQQFASLEVENEARCTSLRNFPHGFKIVRTELPGAIEVPDDQHV